LAAIHVLYVLAATVLLVVAVTMATRHVRAAAFAPTPAYPVATSSGQILDVHRPGNGDTHAATATELPDGRLVAFWFAGSREAAPDVALMTSTFDGTAWSAARALIDGPGTGRAQGRFVKTVGNPVVFRHPSGEYWLIYVSVTLGGWSGSVLNLMRSPDGETWGPPARLVGGPFVDISTLVKAPPLVREDGLVLLPAYHEFITAYPELLVIDAMGRIVDKVRMGSRCLIQPWLVPTGPMTAFALMRPMRCERPRTFVARTEDGGLMRLPAEATDFANPGAPAAAVVLPDGRIVAVLNDSDAGAQTLDLVVSGDGGHSWERRAPVFGGPGEEQSYRYPWLMQDSAGRLHVFVSEGKRAIRHAVIDRAALDRAAAAE
jgi:predicted neuraminidase